MYDQYYGLSGRPFQLTPDPFFYFESGTHRKAMSYLGYGLAQGEGFIVITGEIGAGKTTLVGHLMNTIDPSRLTAVKLVSTQVEGDDLLRLVAQQFSLPWEGLGKAELLRSLEQYLREQARAGRRTLLIVDEGQNLAISALEELRMLSNFQLGGHSLLQIFLLGQPEFRETLFRSPTLEQLRQRVIATHHLEAMEAEEVEPYILHRLGKVGWTGRPGFTEDAFDLIYDHSQGVPRRLNVLMSRLLLYGAIEELDEIDGNDVRAVIGDIAAEGGLDSLGETPAAPAPAPVAMPEPQAYVAAAPAFAPPPQDFAAPPTYAQQPYAQAAFQPQPVASPPPAFLPHAVPQAMPVVAAPAHPSSFAPTPPLPQAYEPAPAASVEQANPAPAFAPPPGMGGASVYALPEAPAAPMDMHAAPAPMPVEPAPFAAPGQQVAFAPQIVEPVAEPAPAAIAPPPFAPPAGMTPRAFPSPTDFADDVEPLPLPSAARNFVEARSLVADAASAASVPGAFAAPAAIGAPAAAPAYASTLTFAPEPAIEAPSEPVTAAAPVRAPFVPAPSSPLVAPPPAATMPEPLPYGVAPFGPPPGDSDPLMTAANDAPPPFGAPSLVSPAAAGFSGTGSDPSTDVVGLQRQLASLESRIADQDVALRRVLDLLIDWVERDPMNAPALHGKAA